MCLSNTQLVFQLTSNRRFLIKYRKMKLLVVLLAIQLLSSSVSAWNGEKEEKINEIEVTFDEIEQNHNKLKKLFEDTVLQEISEDASSKVPVVSSKTLSKKLHEDCTCVPYYLCDNGKRITDGADLLDFRININPCRTIGDICCEPYLINITQRTNEKPQCGLSDNLSVNDDFIDQSTAKFGEYPWTVAITTAELEYKCTGSLIHPQVVLTAAHCVNASQNYTVRAGDWDMSKRDEPYPQQTEDVKLIIKHKKFNRSNLFYNVALLILENPFTLQENIKTVCLPNEAPHPLITHSNNCAASGWGKDKPKSHFRRKMKKVEYSLVTHHACQESLRQTRLGKEFELHHSFACALSNNDLDTCIGDGGGPLVCPIPGKKLRYQQVGITSWGIGCGEGTPAVFTNISQLKSWIDEQFDLLNIEKKYYTLED